MKTVDDLTELQWARIHGRNAGKRGYTSRYNPYIEGFNDTNKELHNAWENARLEAKQFLGI